MPVKSPASIDAMCLSDAKRVSSLRAMSTAEKDPVAVCAPAPRIAAIISASESTWQPSRWILSLGCSSGAQAAIPLLDFRVCPFTFVSTRLILIRNRYPLPHSTGINESSSSSLVGACCMCLRRACIASMGLLVFSALKRRRC